MTRKIVIAGGTSCIAVETARVFASRGDSFFLIARNEERVLAVRRDLLIRGARSVDVLVADLEDCERHEEAVRSATTIFGKIDVLLVAYGILGEQEAGEKDPGKAMKVLHCNFVSVVSLLTRFSPVFEAQGAGCIAVISSVAGDVGRRKNYIYGSSKAGLSTFLSGLRSRLFRAGVAVVTIKPGPVDTPMTKGFRKGVLFRKPGKTAIGIVKAIDRKREIAYLPGYWFWIMLVIRMVPEKLFKRLEL